MLVKVTFAGVSVSVPPKTGLRRIVALLDSHKEWVEERLTALAHMEQPKPDGILYLGEFWQNEIRQGLYRSVLLDDNEHTITSASSLSGAHLVRWYKSQAAFLLPARVRTLADMYQLSYNAVSVRVATNRWGSCNAKGNISLNAKLIMAPQQAIDAIILHELAHTVHMNHGKEFWALLYQLCPWWDSALCWLKENNSMIQSIWNSSKG